ncbi:MAG: MarR family transcriptional regulator [Myxococcales bacterium]|nr:MarR family transcriptional regulator [Myxococcales bacterium]
MASAFEEDILVSIRRMTRAIDLHSRQLAKVHELTGPQLVCLRAIARSEVTDGITPTALAKSVSLSQATVTGILDRLEQRGLLRRERSSADKRVVHLRVTPAGAALVGEAPSPLSERFRRQLASLPASEQAVIDRVLRKVVEMMEAGDVDASPMLTTGDVTADPRAVSAFFGDADEAAAPPADPDGTAGA